MVFPMQMVLLVAALCLDSFVASFAFGAQGIRIPVCSALLVSLLCSIFFGGSLFLGSALGPLLPASLSSAISFCILAALGLARLLDGLLKGWIRKSRTGAADFRFRLMNFSFMLRVWADSTEADSDHSKVLAPREAVPLGIALSLDGLAAGFGAGLMCAGFLMPTILSFAMDLLLLSAGAALGRRLAAKTDLQLSWLGGAMLIMLAFARLW